MMTIMMIVEVIMVLKKIKIIMRMLSTYWS